jgi:hypothetical protein
MPGIFSEIVITSQKAGAKFKKITREKAGAKLRRS